MTEDLPDYAKFTRRPDDVGALYRPQPRLPALVEPTLLPHVTHPLPEPLVEIRHRRIEVLSVYARARWRTARRGAKCRIEVLRRLGRVADSLPRPYGLAIFDAWRPLSLQREIYQKVYGAASSGLRAGYVSVPNTDMRRPPPHLTGGTVDLTLTYDGAPLALGTSFDAFTSKAHSHSLESVPGSDRELRRLLYWKMRAGGFVVYLNEWWHFEYGTIRWAAISGVEARYGPATP